MQNCWHRRFEKSHTCGCARWLYNFPCFLIYYDVIIGWLYILILFEGDFWSLLTLEIYFIYLTDVWETPFRTKQTRKSHFDQFLAKCFIRAVLKDLSCNMYSLQLQFLSYVSLYYMWSFIISIFNVDVTL